MLVRNSYLTKTLPDIVKIKGFLSHENKNFENINSTVIIIMYSI